MREIGIAQEKNWEKHQEMEKQFIYMEEEDIKDNGMLMIRQN